jgi:hypothetical protein
MVCVVVGGGGVYMVGVWCSVWCSVSSCAVLCCVTWCDVVCALSGQLTSLRHTYPISVRSVHCFVHAFIAITHRH